jgi:predicted CoA-binding protein
MEPEIDDFVRCRNLAIVGVSRSGKGFGNAALKELRARGYTASIVHPEATEIGGERCFPDLASLKGEVEGVLISVPPPRAVGVIKDAYASGIRKVWLQRGAESAEALAAAKELGVEAVSGKCILMYAPPVRSIHNFHRAVTKLVGQL